MRAFPGGVHFSNFPGFPGAMPRPPPPAKPRTPGTKHYEVLGVAPTATDDELRAAYRAKVRTEHPDKNPDKEGAHEAFVALQTAYDVLSNPQLRAAYNVGGDEAVAEAANAPPPPPPPPLRKALTVTMRQVFTGCTVTVPGLGEEMVSVHVPPGVPNGHTVAVPGVGYLGADRVTRGSLWVAVTVADDSAGCPYTRITNEAADVEISVDVPVWRCLVGGPVTLPVPPWGGDPPVLNLPSRTLHGRFEIRDAGLPVFGGVGTRGSIIVKVRVAMADVPDDATAVADAATLLGMPPGAPTATGDPSPCLDDAAVQERLAAAQDAVRASIEEIRAEAGGPGGGHGPVVQCAQQ
jgi:DnaJ-class molecular chaperone